MKTLIELFDECQLENIISGLSFVPQKIIFVGFNSVMTKKRIEDMEGLFASKGVKIEFSYEFVGRYNYDEVENRLFDILKENEDCVFDITGGSDVVLAAMGAVAFKNNIPMIIQIYDPLISQEILQYMALHNLEEGYQKDFVFPIEEK